jgi:AsmA protein
MTDRDPPRQPPRPRPPSLEEFRPLTERTGSPLQQLQPPGGQMQRPQPGLRPMPGPRPVPGQRPSSGHATGQRPPLGSVRRADPEDRSGFLTFLMWAGIGLAGLAGLAILALMIWSPAGLVRDQLAARVKAKTGRDLVIAGPTSLSFYPSLRIAMRDVSLSAPPGMGGEPTITMQSLEAAVPLLPLLQKQVNIQGLVLRAPVIDLRVDAQGRRSWDFAAVEPDLPTKRVQYAQAGGLRPQSSQMPKELKDFVKEASPDSVEASTSRGPLAALEALSLEDVRIEGGSIRYADARSGLSESVETIDARIGLPNIASALDIKGSLVWRAEPIAFDSRLTSPKLLAEDRPARLALKVSGRPLDLDYEGAVTLGRTPEADGTVAFKSQALKALLALLGAPQADAAAFNTANISGRLKATEAAVTLSDASLALDQLAAQGNLTIEHRPVRPMIRGNLQIAELDLNKLTLPAAGAAPAAARAPTARAPSVRPATGPTAKPAQSIEDLLRNTEPTPGAKVQGFVQRNGWSDDIIDLSAFRLADADLKLALGKLTYREIKVGQTQMRVALTNRVLVTTFDDIQLYDGRGSGLLRVDGAAASPVIGANFTVDGTSALPLLKDAANFDWVAGRAKVNLALAGQGASERQIVASLQGKADVQFRDGAVVGYNIQKVLQGITQGRFTGLERNTADKTDFSEMAASFNILNGIATNKDLRLLSPVLRITGAGTASLPERTMDYTLRPKLVGAPESAGLEIPVKMAGSWDKPVITPDIDGVLKNPDQTIDTIKQIGKQFKNGDGDAVNKAKDLLNQFLKR